MTTLSRYVGGQASPHLDSVSRVLLDHGKDTYTALLLGRTADLEKGLATKRPVIGLIHPSPPQDESVTGAAAPAPPAAATGQSYEAPSWAQQAGEDAAKKAAQVSGGRARGGVVGAAAGSTPRWPLESCERKAG